MANRDILAIGTSAGGVEALIFLVKRLPTTFPASLLITIHLSPRFRTQLDQILTEAGPLEASFAVDGETIRKGHIYIAPPDRHLIVEDERLRLGIGPRENNSRPAIDPMLRSLALCCGPRSVGVVLTGSLGDGASGLWALGQCGGITVVQDPNDATFADMPINALRRQDPDHIASLADMPALLQRLLSQPAGHAGQPPANIAYEVEVAKTGHPVMDKMDRIGHRSVLACPDCHGVMWEIGEGELTRYRCHVGHTYTAELMAIALDDSLRRALEERLMLARQLHRQAAERGQRHLAASWEHKAADYERELQIVRQSTQRIDELAASGHLEERSSRQTTSSDG